VLAERRAGAKAAFMRKLYPDTIFGAIASSMYSGRTIDRGDPNLTARQAQWFMPK
jgi:trehalose utilization protein